MHLIIGTDGDKISALVAKIRQVDQTGEIQLQHAAEFNPDRLSPASKVYVVGDFPHIVTAYGDKVQKLEDIEIDSGEAQQPKKRGK